MTKTEMLLLDSEAIFRLRPNYFIFFGFSPYGRVDGYIEDSIWHPTSDQQGFLDWLGSDLDFDSVGCA